MKLNIGFFLGSHYGKSKNYSLLVDKVSEWINESNHNVVFGGTESGLMLRLVSNLNNKNKTFFVAPKYWLHHRSKKITTDYISDFIEYI